MGLSAYRLRLRRKRLLLRAFRKGRELAPRVQRHHGLRPDALLAFATLRNERPRLPFWLTYYRNLGIDHFFAVDNGSTDGSADYLAEQPDVSLWQTQGSYKRSRYGMDWMNVLLRRHGHGRWCLTVDPDEFLVYPHCNTRPLRALTDWLDASAIRSYGTLLIDMYADGPVDEAVVREGADPFQVLQWFDPLNYVASRNPAYGNLWIQGGVRLRHFFGETPEHGPALNKIPLVRWSRRYAYVSSTHMLLPRGLNRVYEEWGGQRPCGALLHAKFQASAREKAEEELARRQHYAASREYAAYAAAEPGLWTPSSVRYRGWRQLEALGLVAAGGWF